ncbi:hypothetical protein ACHAQA_002356 [Verticillium albo-atrum]
MLPDIMMAQAFSSLPPDIVHMDTPRKVKNRLAQRRLREKRAQEKKEASHRVEELPESGIDSLPSTYTAPHAHASAPFPQHPVQPVDPAGGPSTNAGTVYEEIRNANRPDQIAEATLNTSMAITDTTNHAFESEIPTWEAQLFDEFFEMGGLDSASRDATMGYSPTATDQSSPPSPSRATSTSPTAKGKLAQSQAALQAFRAQMLAIWTEEAGCVITPKYDRPEPLLHAAARIGNRQVIQMLLDHGADINARDVDGRTPLHSAIEGFKGDAIIFLLEAGIDVNAHDDQGRTALSMAVQNNCEKAVDLFLRHGADPTLGGSDLLRSTHAGFTKGHRVIEQ